MGPAPLNRLQTNASAYSGSTLHQSPEGEYPPMPEMIRSPTSTSVSSYGMPPRSTPGPNGPYGDFNRTGSAATSRPMPPRSDYGDYNRSASPAPARPMPPRSEYGDYTSVIDDYASTGRASPAPSQMSSRPAYQDLARSMGPSYGQGQGGYPGPGGYPNRSQTGPVPQRGPFGQPQRNMTAPMPRYQSPAPQQGYQTSQPQMYQNQAPQEYFNRPGTAQSQRSMQGLPQPQRRPTNQSGHSRLGSGYSDDLESQRGTPGPRY
jgi:hypothetical protein